jgi:hypothetical protein
MQATYLLMLRGLRPQVGELASQLRCLLRFPRMMIFSKIWLLTVVRGKGALKNSFERHARCPPRLKRRMCLGMTSHALPLRRPGGRKLYLLALHAYDVCPALRSEACLIVLFVNFIWPLALSGANVLLHLP